MRSMRLDDFCEMIAGWSDAQLWKQEIHLKKVLKERTDPFDAGMRSPKVQPIFRALKAVQAEVRSRGGYSWEE